VVEEHPPSALAFDPPGHPVRVCGNDLVCGAKHRDLVLALDRGLFHSGKTMLDELDRNKGQIGRGIEQFANGTLDSTGTPAHDSIRIVKRPFGHVMPLDRLQRPRRRPPATYSTAGSPEDLGAVGRGSGRIRVAPQGGNELEEGWFPRQVVAAAAPSRTLLLPSLDAPAARHEAPAERIGGMGVSATQPPQTTALNDVNELQGTAANAAEPPQRTAALKYINGLEITAANRRKRRKTIIP
jgi:hypothetical protein